MFRFRAPLFSGALAAVIVLLTGCATLGSRDPAGRQSGHQSDGLQDLRILSPLATDTAGYESMLTGYLKNATRRMMEMKGFVYTESNPDVLVNFYVNIQDVQEIRSSPTYAGGYYGYRAGYYGGYYGGFSTTQHRDDQLSGRHADRRRRGRKAEGRGVGVHGGRPCVQGGAQEPGACDRRSHHGNDVAHARPWPHVGGYSPVLASTSIRVDAFA